MAVDNNSAIELRWLTSLAEIDAVAQAWRALDAASQARFVWFQSYEWCRHWIENHGTLGTSPRILMVLRGGEPTAILPLQLKRIRPGIKMLEILGAPHTQYANILTPTGTLSAAEVTCIRAALAAAPGTDAAVFTLVPAGSALAQVLAGNKPHATFENDSAQFEFAHLKGAAFETTLRADKQRDLRRQFRMLEKIGPVTLEALRPGAAGYREAIDKCLAMKADWLTSTGKMGESLMYDGHARFLAAMAKSAEPSDGPYAWVMKAGDRPIAIEIGYLQRGHYYAYMGGFDWSERKASPGKLQMGLTLNALAALGAKEYDLLANPTDYKLEYSTKQHHLSGVVLNLTPRGVLYTKLWTRALYPLLRRAFYALPAGLRQAASSARRNRLVRSG